MEENKELFAHHLCAKPSAGVMEVSKTIFQPSDYYKAGNIESGQKAIQDLCAATHDCFFIGLEIKMRYEDGLDPTNASTLKRYKRCAERMLAALKRCHDSHAVLSDSDYLSDCVFGTQKAQELIKLIDKARRGQKKRGQFIGSEACIKVCQIIERFIP